MSVINLPMRRCVALLIGLSLWEGTLAEEAAAFRVCADPNNLPFSAKSEDGFENRIAEIWATELGLPIEYTWFPQRRGFVRKTLKALNESGSEYKCDVVMGVAAGFDRLLTTKPYYRSTYALVYVKGRDLDGVASGEDFINLKPEIRDGLRIAAFTPTPGAKWLARHGMNEQLVPFLAMSGDPEAYPGEIIEKELVEGRLDAAIIWGPIAGYFANRAKPAEIAVVLLESEPGIQFDFAISAGVRYGDSGRKQVLEELILKMAEPMQTVFAAYDVPLLEIEPDTDPLRASDDD
jgi:mxaJ protein